MLLIDSYASVDTSSRVVFDGHRISFTAHYFSPFVGVVMVCCGISDDIFCERDLRGGIL